jgi:hypothetical protein
MGLPTGEKLGPYEIQSVLGAGAWERYIVRGTRGFVAMLR